jgi:acetyl-CoA C-acetyltransferase
MSGGKAIVIAARRTAIGRVGGLHKARRLEHLAAPLIQAVIADAGVDVVDIGEVIIGNAVGGGGNPARLIALAAGLPETIPGYSIDRQCASGLDAIVAGARLIETGAAEAVIAGGVESASTAPWRLEKPSNLYTDAPRFFHQAAFTPSARHDPDMIHAAENVARECGITRARQDAFALQSHERALESHEASVFAQEIVPLGKGPGQDRDEGPRPTLSPRLLARMPSLLPDGTVTAGNSCAISDGAAVALLVSEALHRRLGGPAGLRLIAAASAGIAPRILGLASVPALKAACRRAGIQPGDLTAIELNEAFASQVLATMEALSVNPHIINRNGGALAFGHPYGASGAVLVARLYSRFIRNHTGLAPGPAAAMIAAAGGVGVAALFTPTAF